MADEQQHNVNSMRMSKGMYTGISYQCSLLVGLGTTASSGAQPLGRQKKGRK